MEQEKNKYQLVDYIIGGVVIALGVYVYYVVRDFMSALPYLVIGVLVILYGSDKKVNRILAYIILAIMVLGLLVNGIAKLK